MPSPATNAGEGSAQKKTYDGTVQTTRRVTVKQLSDAKVTETGIVDGKDLVNVRASPLNCIPALIVMVSFTSCMGRGMHYRKKGLLGVMKTVRQSLLARLKVA